MFKSAVRKVIGKLSKRRRNSQVPDDYPPFTQSGPPRVELQGTKWFVENHVGDELRVEVAPSEGLYIHRCHGCRISVTGKALAIAIEDCINTTVMFSKVLSQCEVIKCISTTCAFDDTPTLVVDGSSNCRVVLKEGFAGDIVSSRSDHTTVQLVHKGKKVERRIPEKFVSRIQKQEPAAANKQVIESLCTTPME